MADQSPILSLPLMQASQAQKHVTHNEALMRLDLLVQLTVENRALTTPPATPAEADRHIVPVGATGAWAGQAGKIALWQDGAWQFIAAVAGWQAWVLDEQALVVFNGGIWVTGGVPSVLSVAQVGISTSSDATNRLAVSAPAVLFNHAGAGHQVKLNKASTGDTASLLLQTGFSGRAEMGLAGDDNFSLKVSANGASFATALKVDAATAGVELFKPVVLTGQASDPAAPVSGMMWHNAAKGQLRARLNGQTHVITGQADLPWLQPVAGDLVMTTFGAGGTTTVLAGAAGRIDLFPFTARGEGVFDALGINCTTAVAAAQAKLVVYAADVLGRPDALLLETGTLDLATTGNKLASAALTLLPGQTYWLGVRHSSTATLSAWNTQCTPDINGGSTMATTARKVLRRTATFASAAPTNWGFLASEIASAVATAIWLRQA
jgi:Protein of unknown function (DUF2793)